MTTEQYIKRQHEKLDLLKEGKAIAIAATDTHTKMTARIFEEGETAQGNKLKYDSTDPIYVNPKDSPKSFPVKGKDGDVKFKNGKNHKTGYFKSYQEYRQKIGRESGFMNLNLFGVLQSDFGKGVVKVDGSAYASTVTQEANKGKLEKFSTFFKLNAEERESFRDVLEFESLEILKAI
jgi:hypothetical protein